MGKPYDSTAILSAADSMIFDLNDFTESATKGRMLPIETNEVARRLSALAREAAAASLAILCAADFQSEQRKLEELRKSLVG